MSAKKIGQRKARALQKRVEVLEFRGRMTSMTPSPRWCVAEWNLEAAQEREIEQGVRFQHSYRIERTGKTLRLFVYQEPAA